MTVLSLNARRVTRTRVLEEYFPMQGGLNEVDAPVRLPPGVVIASKNYESYIRQGYRRIDGYERADGRARPSTTSYYLIFFDSGSQAFSDGDTVVTASSGVTLEVVADATLTGGSYAGGDAAGYFPAIVISGSGATMIENEDLIIASTSVAITSQKPEENGSVTESELATYRAAAIEARRSVIEAVPGQGAVRGVWRMDDTIYAVRDKPGGESAGLYKSTASGWSEIDKGYYIEFTGGGGGTAQQIEEGDIIVGATSAASATVLRVVVRSGDWSTNDAVGRITVASVTSGPFQTEAINVGGVKHADGVAEVANTLPNGGRYEWESANFYGHTRTNAIYAVNGVSQAFEYRPNDGAFTFVVTGMDDDKPKHLRKHRGYLFLAFSGGSLQHSSENDPLVVNAITGASELALGDEITGMVVEIGDVMMVFTLNDSWMLTGTSASNWNLQRFHQGSGAKEWTVQKVGVAWALDDRGIVSAAATERYGDFAQATVSESINTFLKGGASPRIDRAVASVRSRRKNQYRVFFDDGSAIYMTFFNNQVIGLMPIDLGIAPTCIESTEDTSGRERLYFGAADGFVYELDAGNSFDGAAISYYLKTAYYHYRSPNRQKKFRKIEFEMEDDGDAAIFCVLDYSFGGSAIPISNVFSLSASGGGGLWEISSWNEFKWDAQIVSNARVKADGYGYNMSILLYGESTYDDAHIIQGAIVQYSYRRVRR